MKKFNKNIIGVVAIIAILGSPGFVFSATAVNLGAADNFVILAGSGITIGGAVNTSTITGDIGTFPTVSITGIGNAVLTGTNHAGNGTTQAAKTALTTAYANAGQAAVTVTTELGSTTKTPGVYDSLSGTFEMTGTLTLDAEGDADAVFIFRTGTTLTTAGASNVTLINGAQACNVFWQVGSSATLGASSFFKGNILATVSIGMGTGSQIEGRVLAQNGSVTLDGTNVITKATCVVPPPPPIPPTPPTPDIPNNNSFTPLPPINVTKIPNPLALPNGAGSVVYTFRVTNSGGVPLQNITVADNKCTPVIFISGDTDNNLMLDASEVWVYTCTKTVLQTETNTVTASGWANGWVGYDTANATVVVGASFTPPLIHLEKRPNIFLLAAPGGPVTYMYTVTNPGTAALSDVSVVDDKCTGLPGRVFGHPGDLNQNNLLESNEVWSFTCQTNLTQTTTNIGTAQGHANGLTAIDFSSATVVVGTPSLPNTGHPPEEDNSTPWGIWIFIGGVLTIVMLSRMSVLGERTH